MLMTARRIVAGAALALALAAPAPADVPPTVTINLVNYAFAPRPIALAAGRSVRLLFVNRSDRGHDFTAQRFFAAAHIVSGAARGGEVDVARGRSATIDLIPARGRYDVHCGRFTHKQRGMKAEIIVE